MMGEKYNFVIPELDPVALRQSSLAWFERIGPTLIDHWPADVLALSMPTTFIRFPVGMVDDLFEPHHVVPPSVCALADELDAAMGWNRHFVRLNSRSPKDALWPFETLATCSGKEALMCIGSSERCLDDLAHFEYIPEHPAFICLRKFVQGLHPHGEYRCFVRDGELIAVTSYDYHNPLAAPEDGGKAVRERIAAWFTGTLKPRLHVETVVFDVFLDWDGGVLLIELNPYGLSDPCCLGSYERVESFAGFVAYADALTERCDTKTHAKTTV